MSGPELIAAMRFTPEQIAVLERWHEAMNEEYECEAALEGQLCCVDLLVGWLRGQPK